MDHHEQMELLAINKTADENANFLNDPLCREITLQVMDLYKKAGFVSPWLCYFARKNNFLVGSAGFKGPPANGMVEIAYGTFEEFRQQGIGALMCGQLVDLCLRTDPSIKITARTLPQENFSTRILEKNNFKFNGTITDPEDGPVWEWVYSGNL